VASITSIRAASKKRYRCSKVGQDSSTGQKFLLLTLTLRRKQVEKRDDRTIPRVSPSHLHTQTTHATHELGRRVFQLAESRQNRALGSRKARKQASKKEKVDQWSLFGGVADLLQHAGQLVALPLDDTVLS